MTIHFAGRVSPRENPFTREFSEYVSYRGDNDATKYSIGGVTCVFENGRHVYRSRDCPHTGQVTDEPIELEVANNG